MVHPQLTSMAENPVAILPKHVAKKPTRLVIRQCVKSWKGLSGCDIKVWSIDPEADVKSAKYEDTPPLYTCQGKATSWTQQRTVSDSAGLALFNIKRKSMGVTWSACVPDHDDKVLVTFAMKGDLCKDKFDVCVHGGKGKNVHLQILGQDIWKIRTNVYLGDKVVMTTKRPKWLDVYVPLKSLRWEVDVAQGFDTSLVRLRI